MAVAFDATSESHTGTTGNTSAASFTWNHGGAASGVKGILVFCFNTSAASDIFTSVTYDNVALTALSPTASDTAGEAGFTKAFFLGTGVSQGTKAVVVNRTNNANEAYAVAVTVTAAIDTETAGVIAESEQQVLAEENVNDGSLSGTNSVRFAGVFSGLGDVTASLLPGLNSTVMHTIDFGNRVVSTVRETTAGTGSRPVGFTSGVTSDDVAAVYLAVREKSYSPTVVLNSPADASSTSDTTPTLDFTGTDANSQDVRYNVQIQPGSSFDLVDSYSESNQSTNGILSTVNTGYAQSFTSTGGHITSCVFYLKINNSPTGNATASLYALSGTHGTDAIPTGAALATSNALNVATLTTSFALTTLTFPTPYRTSAGTNYIIALEYNSGNVTRELHIGFDNTSSTHGGNQSREAAAGTWTSQAGDLVFYVYTTPLLDKVSGTDSGFVNPDTGGDTDPFNSGENIQYTVQAGDALAADTYYWRVRGKDPAGSNAYGDWSSTRSFEVTSGDVTLLTNDITNSLTLDNTTITQNHIVADADVAISLTTDNTTITQNHVIATDDITISLTEDNDTVTETNFVISSQDITNTLTTDNDTITQNHIIADQDITNNLTIDNATIAQNHIVVTQDVAISLTEDNTSIIENFTVASIDTAISLTTDNTTINQNHVLTPDDIAFAMSTDADTISQNHIIATQDITNSLTTDNATITQNQIIVTQDIANAVTEDSTTVVETNFILAVQDVAIALTTDNDTISQNHVVATQDIAITLTEDATTISQNHVVSSQDVALSLTEDNGTITQTNFILTVQDTTVSLTEDNATLNQNHIVQTQDIAVATTEDNITIGQNHIISVQDVIINLTEDNTTVELGVVIIVSDDVALTLTTDDGTVSPAGGQAGKARLLLGVG